MIADSISGPENKVRWSPLPSSQNLQTSWSSFATRVRSPTMGAGYVLAKGQRNPIDVFARVELVEKSGGFVLKPNLVDLIHVGNPSEGELRLPE